MFEEELEKKKDEQAKIVLLASLTESLLKHMASGSEAQVQEALGEVPAPLTVSDLVKHQNYAGMTAVHMAARLRRPDRLKEFLQVAPSAASLVTFSTGKPEGWTPLHCVLDATPSWAKGKQ